MVVFLLLAVLSYFAGSVNYSILLFRVLGKEDPRNNHSKNPGATNVYRQAGLFWAAVVLLLDVGRAFVVGYAAVSWLEPQWVALVGLALILGNRYPCFHGFDGGKGVANYLGFILAIAPGWAGLGMLAWGAAHAIWRTPFLSSFSMVLVMSIGTAFGASLPWQGVIGVFATAGFIVWCHHSNIQERWGNNKVERQP